MLSVLLFLISYYKLTFDALDRFLVSFGGTYLGNDTNVVPSGCKSDGDSSSMDHQLLKIHVPRTEAGLFGPAFVEVEVLTKYPFWSSFQAVFLAYKRIILLTGPVHHLFVFCYI